MILTGLHHVTAIASDPVANVRFYTEILGLRLVKKTVNFDDPGTYHLYFGDAAGSPGTILTFFPFEDARRGVPGVGQATAFAFCVPSGTLEKWRDRLQGFGATEPVERFGERLLTFHDPDGFLIELVESSTETSVTPWNASPVPSEIALQGFHGVTLSLEAAERTGDILKQLLGATPAGSEGNRFRYALGGSSIDLLCLPAGRRGTGGAGIVHHVAWRTPDDSAQLAARAELVSAGFNVSPVMDRNYFHSIYFREPGGVLFEIATDPPGFAVDESPESLGSNLMLPRWLEPQREILERTLPPLR
ncbi:MAG: ring-cleaving dioxygenase [Terrimicrobiaceae bacterium]|nr:ring-cleaving dioxygenase [Terrimicrobiaceae bacterium]